MATTLRFSEGVRDFYLFDDKGIDYRRKLVVSIDLDGENVGIITRDGKITITTPMESEASANLCLFTATTFTETQWNAIGLRAKEFKERCARLAKEQDKQNGVETLVIRELQDVGVLLGG